MTALITVVCDSKKHVRGKVAKLAAYIVAKDGAVRQDLSHQDCRIQRAKDAGGSFQSPMNQRLARIAVNGSDGKAPACKLCGAKIPARIEDALRGVAAESATPIVTVTLATLCSRIKR